MGESHHHDHEHAHHHHDHAQDHGHHHHHGDGHAHTHDHSHDVESYFLDQFCMIGLSAAFGAVCLTLYIVDARTPEDGRQTMLKLLLGPQFHPFILASGIALVVVALFRAATLWGESTRPAHEHDHEACGPSCDHENVGHDHAHGPAHHHHHDHDAEDHDHGWAPWRYVVLLVPIILFLLGLPNKLPGVGSQDVKVDMTKDAMNYAGLVALGPFGNAQVGVLPPLFAGGKAEMEMQYKQLEGLAASAESRDEWRGRTIAVRGQFSPSPTNDHVFSLVRQRIQCCAADAIQLRVPMIARESLRGLELRPDDWVKVTGTIDFRESGGAFTTVLMLPNQQALERCPPDNNPWIQ